MQRQEAGEGPCSLDQSPTSMQQSPPDPVQKRGAPSLKALTHIALEAESHLQKDASIPSRRRPKEATRQRLRFSEER